MLDLRSGFALAWGAQGTPGPFTPLTFSGIDDTAALADTSEVIAWHVDPAAQGQVQWGTSSGVYPNATTLETGFLTFHRQTITGLTPATPYFYRIRGVSIDGQEAFSAERTFTTLASAPPPSVSDEQAWVQVERDAMTPPALSGAVTLAPGTYTGAQWKAWVQGLSNGSAATWTNAVATGVTVNMTGNDTNVWSGKSYIKLTFTDSVLNAQQTLSGSDAGYWVMKNATHHIWVFGGTTDGHFGSVAVPGAFGDGNKAPLTGKGNTHHVRFSGHTWLRSSGFGIYLTSLDGGANPPGSAWPTAYWIHDNFMESPFQGYSLICARHFIAERNTFRDIQGSYCDFESEYYGNGLDGVYIHGDTVRRFGYQCSDQECRLINAVPNGTDGTTGFPFSGTSLLNGTLIPMNDVVITDIYVPEGYYTGTRGGFLLRANKANPKTNWKLKRIICDQASTMAGTSQTNYNHFDTLEVSGNKQILADHGSLYHHGADGSGANYPDVNVVSTPNTT